MPVTLLYASLLALMLVILSISVIRQRLRHDVSLMDDGTVPLTRAIRAHGNFIEYVPLALILMGLLEAQAASRMLLHILGIALVTGRILHAYSIMKVEPQTGKIHFRQAGMVLTFGILLLMAAFGMVKALGALTAV